MDQLLDQPFPSLLNIKGDIPGIYHPSLVPPIAPFPVVNQIS
jgi:hypothetical protein